MNAIEGFACRWCRTFYEERMEAADCRSSTYDCAEQVQAVLRGEGPQGWESREGGA